ncbi:MAG: hypothetical protein CMJ18_22135 [Phycisphaeraceae bacterium]|nr:hypothetical protein [Phycisphaeraceae bacterium]
MSAEPGPILSTTDACASLTGLTHDDLETSLLDRFRAVVAEFGDRHAVSDARGDTITYDELNRQANRVAHQVLDRSLREDATVALMLGHDAGRPVAMIGVLKTGMAYVPLDPAGPDRVLSEIFVQSDARVLVTDDAHADVAARICPDPGRIVNLDRLEDEMRCADPETSPQPGDLAYVIFTSGTTGTPKGVMHSHRNLMHLVMMHAGRADLGPEDRVAMLYSYTAGAGVKDLFSPLLYGARVCMLDVRKEGIDGLAEMIERDRVTLLHTVPTVFRQLCVRFGPDNPPGFLRRLFLGGEPLTAHDVRLFQKHCDRGCILSNSLGASEAGIFRSAEFDMDARLDTDAAPAGYPVPDKQVLILDDAGHPRHDHEIGEVAVRSRYLALGYWKQPELSAKVFLPVSDDDDRRIYLTGDVGRLRPDGCLELAGRRDNQVKIRGHRVQMDKVEQTLLGIDAIREAAVVAHKDASGVTLAAYLVADPDTRPAVLEIRQALSRDLADHMIPTAFVFLDALPFNAAGKLDKAALPAPQRRRADLDASYVAPRDDTEQCLASIYADLLGLDRVGVHDDFFELGGHSLLATLAISRVRDRLTVPLTLPELFDAPTIAALAPRLAGRTGDDRPRIPRADRDGPLPLSVGQRRLWFIHRLAPDRPTYNVAKAFHLTGELDLPDLQHALDALVRRHDALRTTFREHDGEPIQVVHEAVKHEIQVLDLRHLVPARRAVQAERLKSRIARTPFDLERGPLTRFTVLITGDGRHELILVMHHIISDYWSSWLLLREWAELYAARREQRPSTLDDPSLQYVDFATWQAEHLKGETLDRLLDYWADRLGGAPDLLALPSDRPRPDVQTNEGDRHVMMLPPEVRERLEAIAIQEHVTLYAALMAAFKMLLVRYTGQTDLVVGSPVANRQHIDLEKVIGFFANTLPIRTRLCGDPSYREVLRRVQDTAVSAFAHQDIPFDKLVEHLKIQRTLRYAPLVQVVLSLQNTPIRGATFPGVEIETNPGIIAVRTAKFDLSITIHMVDEGLECIFDYNTDIFDRGTIERLSRHFGNVIESVTTNPDVSVSDASLMDETERRRTADLNDTVTHYPRDETIHALFETQARSTPGAIALVHDEDRITYGDLNDRADRLARTLTGWGVGPDVPVAICLDRSPELIVAMLGVLKAGGAYVPMEAAWPRQRLEFMLRDASAPIVLTTERHAEVLCGLGARVVRVDAAEEPDDRCRTASTPDRPGPEHLACVMYTSGSTGEPKGVMVPHRGVVRLVRGVDYVPLEAGQVTLQMAPVTFDASTFEIWGPLLNGGCCVLFPHDVPTVRNLADAVRDFGVTCLWLTASLFNTVVDHDPLALETVEHVLTGGEALSPAHVRAALDHLPGTRLVNGYGPTESTTFATTFEIPHDGQDGTTPVPIGRPIGNTTVRILDSKLRSVPIGIPGEICIGGDGLARGYLNRPELTAERFIEAPDTAERLYRTGDIGRFREDGLIEYHGRTDEQVKIRGHRIEPGEIETVLRHHPDVREAAVVVRDQPSGEPGLFAFVVTTRKRAVDPDELQNHLARALPAFMIPTGITVMDRFPLTANGKLDRDALVPARHETRSKTATVELPRSVMEQQLAAAWSELLGVDAIGPEDNFFELGGHSLLAVRFVAWVQRTYGHELPLSLLFETPTIASLAEHIEYRPNIVSSPLVSLQPEGRRPPFFCVHGIGGEVMFLRPIARRLSPDQPFYGIQARGLRADEAPDTDVATMARRYLDAIREITPSGPYYLGGYSSGGAITWEMARQLRDAGEDVAYLAFFDAPAPGTPHRRLTHPVRLARIAANLPRWIRHELLTTDFLTTLVRARGRMRHWLDGMKVSRDDPHADKVLPDIRAVFGVTDLPEQRRRFLETHFRAVRSYEPIPTNGSVTVFRSHIRSITCPGEPDMGWSALARGGVDVRSVPGSHNQMFQERWAHHLADALAASLVEAQRRSAA